MTLLFQKVDVNMTRLYFRYGAMGSSKTANALITKFNYEERGMKVWLIKPAIDTRDGADVVRSRIGLEAKAYVATPDINLFEAFQAQGDYDVVIADESQFFTAKQIDELRRIVDELEVPVLCYGLRTDFLTHLFEGSRRLFEVADSIVEIKTVCSCGDKATVNARIDESGRVVTEGGQILLGGNDSYIAMCHACWKKQIALQEAGK
jgi:thymidine kinase